MQSLFHNVTTALCFLPTEPMCKDLIAVAVHAAHVLRKCALDAGTHRAMIAITRVLNSPGAVASMAFLAAMRPRPAGGDARAARHLMRVFCAPPFFINTMFPSLLDGFFTLPLLCAVPYEPEDAARLVAKCTTPVALQYLTQPMAHQSVCAAASLAILATLDERFVGHLADGEHLEVLLDAVRGCNWPDEYADDRPCGCCDEWHTTALLIAVAHAASACRIAAPAVMEEGEEETRRKRPRMGLDASDVGVQHRSSTIFLIAARPFTCTAPYLRRRRPF